MQDTAVSDIVTATGASAIAATQSLLQDYQDMQLKMETEERDTSDLSSLDGEGDTDIESLDTLSRSRIYPSSCAGDDGFGTSSSSLHLPLLHHRRSHTATQSSSSSLSAMKRRSIPSRSSSPEIPLAQLAIRGSSLPPPQPGYLPPPALPLSSALAGLSSPPEIPLRSSTKRKRRGHSVEKSDSHGLLSAVDFTSTSSHTFSSTTSKSQLTNRPKRSISLHSIISHFPSRPPYSSSSSSRVKKLKSSPLSESLKGDDDDDIPMTAIQPAKKRRKRTYTDAGDQLREIKKNIVETHNEVIKGEYKGVNEGELASLMFSERETAAAASSSSSLAPISLIPVESSKLASIAISRSISTRSASLQNMKGRVKRKEYTEEARNGEEGYHQIRQSSTKIHREQEEEDQSEPTARDSKLSEVASKSPGSGRVKYKKRQGKHQGKTFDQNLFGYIEAHPNSKTVTWSKDGKYLLVYDLDQLRKELNNAGLAQQNHLNSLVKQLTNYHFHLVNDPAIKKRYSADLDEERKNLLHIYKHTGSATLRAAAAARYPVKPIKAPRKSVTPAHSSKITSDSELSDISTDDEEQEDQEELEDKKQSYRAKVQQETAPPRSQRERKPLKRGTYDEDAFVTEGESPPLMLEDESATAAPSAGAYSLTVKQVIENPSLVVPKKRGRRPKARNIARLEEEDEEETAKTVKTAIKIKKNKKTLSARERGWVTRRAKEMLHEEREEGNTSSISTEITTSVSSNKRMFKPKTKQNDQNEDNEDSDFIPGRQKISTPKTKKAKTFHRFSPSRFQGIATSLSPPRPHFRQNKIMSSLSPQRFKMIRSKTQPPLTPPPSESQRYPHRISRTASYVDRSLSGSLSGGEEGEGEQNLSGRQLKGKRRNQRETSSVSDSVAPGDPLTSGRLLRALARKWSSPPEEEYEVKAEMDELAEEEANIIDSNKAEHSDISDPEETTNISNIKVGSDTINDAEVAQNNSNNLGTLLHAAEDDEMLDDSQEITQQSTREHDEPAAARHTEIKLEEDEEANEKQKEKALLLLKLEAALLQMANIQVQVNENEEMIVALNRAIQISISSPQPLSAQRAMERALNVLVETRDTEKDGNVTPARRLPLSLSLLNAPDVAHSSSMMGSAIPILPRSSQQMLNGQPSITNYEETIHADSQILSHISAVDLHIQEHSESLNISDTATAARAQEPPSKAQQGEPGDKIRDRSRQYTCEKQVIERNAQAPPLVEIELASCKGTPELVQDDDIACEGDLSADSGYQAGSKFYPEYLHPFSSPALVPIKDTFTGNKDEDAEQIEEDLAELLFRINMPSPRAMMAGLPTGKTPQSHHGSSRLAATATTTKQTTGLSRLDSVESVLWSRSTGIEKELPNLKFEGSNVTVFTDEEMDLSQSTTRQRGSDIDLGTGTNPAGQLHYRYQQHQPFETHVPVPENWKAYEIFKPTIITDTDLNKMPVMQSLTLSGIIADYGDRRSPARRSEFYCGSDGSRDLSISPFDTVFKH